MLRCKRLASACLTVAVLLTCVSFSAQAWSNPVGQGGDDYRRAYLIAQAHIDTAWEWPYRTTAGEIVPETFGRALKALKSNADYTFTMSASKHYEWFKEYGSAAQWEQLKELVASGRWDILGGQVVENDVLYPSGEALARQSLYGQHYFQKEFGKMAAVGYLPDDFGHSGSMPQILKKSGMDTFAHARGGTGKSPLYNWTGIDGSSVLAYDINFGSWYANRGLDLNIADQGQKIYGDAVGLSGDKKIRYSPMMYGSGDHGGGPNRGTALAGLFDNGSNTYSGALEDAKAKNPGYDIGFGTLTGYFGDMTGDAALYGGNPDLLARLNGLGARQDDELYLGFWSLGCYSSWARIKKYNRQNELLAESAEKAATLAYLLGAPSNSAQRIETAWDRILTNQFHDVLPGTAAPVVYQEAFNGSELAKNLLLNTQSGALAAMAAHADTDVGGVPVLVFNHLSWARDGEVTVEVDFGGPAPGEIKVLHGAQEMPSQVLARDGDMATLRFLAKDVPGVGYKVFDVTAGAPAFASPLSATAAPGADWVLENENLVLTIDHATGYIKSLVNKNDGGREAFMQGAGTQAGELHVYHYTNPGRDRGASAWSLAGSDINREPDAFFDTAPLAMELAENSGGNVTVKVTKGLGDTGTEVSQYYKLTPGADRVDVRMEIDWTVPDSMLKVSFPIAADAAEASYETAGGAARYTTRRVGDLSLYPTGEDKRFEQLGHKWMDVTDEGGTHGVSIFNDAKYGYDVWRKGDFEGTNGPSQNINGQPYTGAPFVCARITAVHCTSSHTLKSDEPAYNGPESVYMDRNRQDFNYAIYPHAGGWEDAGTVRGAYELCSPMPAAQVTKGSGVQGNAASFLGTNRDNIIISAVKNPYAGPGDDPGGNDTLIVRVYESTGRDTPGVVLRLPANVISAEEVNLLEHEYPEGRGTLAATGDTVQLGTVGKFEIVTLRVQLAGAAAPQAIAQAQAALPFNLRGTSANRNPLKRFGGLDGKGNFIPQELWPQSVEYNGVQFGLGLAGDKNFVEARGQSVNLPQGSYNKLYILGAAADGQAGKTAAGRYTIDKNAAAGDFTVRYTDGSAAAQTIAFAGWLSDLSGWDPTANEDLRPALGDAVGQVFGHYHGEDGNLSFLDKLMDCFVKAYYCAEDFLTGSYHGTRANKLDKAAQDNYLFVYAIDLAPGKTAGSVTLPDVPGIKIAAMTAANSPV